ncbi:MAG: efflux RND transporter periplasmic adaptor subunit [Kiritimatiellae bacterium]|nr:efflux RND transporter periplasmic adaptor subunit [Kiritimatiellia bacterium]
MKQKTIILLAVATFATIPLLAEDKHDHSHTEFRTPTADELFTVKCEHDIPQSSCDECRYELGLVKVDPSILIAPSKPGGLIRVEPVKKRDAQLLLPLNGEIALNEAALTHLSPRVSGTVRSIRTGLGKEVKTDDVLFEIESPELGLAVGAYRKNKALAALAVKNLEREKSLAAQKISPEADAVEAQMKYDEYRIELESAGNALAVMGLNAEAIATLTADDQIGKPCVLPVHAPQNGIIIQKHLDMGETIERGRDVLTIADLSSVWVWLEVYEDDLALLTSEAKKKALAVQITISSLPARIFESTIDLIGMTMNEETRTVSIRAVLDNTEGLLRPGMFCAANIVFETPEKVIAVPKNALMADEGKQFVFGMIRDGFAQRIDVETGRIFADSVEITAGLQEGALIAVEGAFLLKSDVLRSKMGAGCAD